IMFFISMAVIGGIITSATSDKIVHVKDNSILEIKLDNPIPERTSKNPFENFDPLSMDAKQSIGLNDILKSLNNAKTDDKIKGIFLNLSAIPAGIATIEEIRGALINFKDSSDKFIIAYSDVYSQGAYYLATAADKIYLNPKGLVDFKGLNAEIMFFTKVLENIGIEPQIIRGKTNKFKSAVEPFMYTEMSEANREQTLTFMASIWNYLLKGISDKRGVSVENLNMYADSLKIENAQEALNYKLIDGLKYKDEILAELKELTKIKPDDKINFVSMSNYSKTAKSDKNKKFSKNKIAIVFASGQIFQGEGDEQTIGGETLSEAIREARMDSTVKAIVLRVNSPGGDALASEVIWREVSLAKKSKPVIVSMGDYAASGGYYISCPADVIVCNPTTLTGSIGVFGILWNGKEFLNDKVGIYIDNVKTNTYADLGSIYRPLSAPEKDVIQRTVEEVYTTFIGHVAEGRNTSTEYVDSIGQGRVWSGINAKEIGLIDEFGGLIKAIEIAADKAGISEYRFVGYPKQKDPFEQFLEQFLGNTQETLVKKHLGQSYVYYKKLSNAMTAKGIQTRLPFDIEIY
ncbi:MAG: signal peptide peptidase SppA, partial [Bacteroidota bacterium]